MESLKVLNKRLVDNYGQTIDSRPNFRLVHTSTEYEKRYGQFEDYYGNIFIREFTGVREVKKYSYITPDTWVLERLVYGETDLPGVMSNYEPCWAFHDSEGKPVYPVWKAVEFLVNTVLNGVNKTIKKTTEDIKADDKIAFDKEVNEFYEILGGNDNPYGNQKANFVKPMYLNSNSGSKE